jgi:hypothetical protein
MYIALRTSFREEVHLRVLVACLLVPSVVYWSSGLLKESVAMAGIGWVILGMQQMLRRRFLRGAVSMVVGAVPIALMKPYVLVAFSVSAAVWYYWNRLKSKGRASVLSHPLRLAIGLTLGIGGVMLLGQMFPRFAFDTLGEQLALQQELCLTVSGGSTFVAVGSTQSTMAGQLVYAPQALVASLFRPFIFEVNNVQMLINALETTALTYLFVRVVWKERWKRLMGHLSASPVLMFFLSFSVVFGIPVGLGTNNLGTLSRYRMPLVPFFAGLVLVLDYLVVKGKVRSEPSQSSEKCVEHGAIAR